MTRPAVRFVIWSLVTVFCLLHVPSEVSAALSDDSLHSVTTRRNFVYSYFYEAPQHGQPTIIFLHGFPSTHHDWAAQISYFVGKGYGVIAPDLLGYGGTSAPEDVGSYRILDIAGDIIDILDHEKVDKVIAVGHDWGAVPLARILNTHVDRVLGAAFLSVGYLPPRPDFNFDAYVAQLHQTVGYDVFGHMKFFAEDDAATILSDHLDSFYSLFFPSDPFVWRTDLAPLGKAKEWIERNRMLPRPRYWTAEQEREHQKRLLEKGLKAPLLWYRGWVNGINNADDATIPLAAYNISIPVFFGLTLQDYIDIPSLTLPPMLETCSKLTVYNFTTSHWVMQEAPDELNEQLDQFFETI